jgi:hypothetical protein
MTDTPPRAEWRAIDSAPKDGDDFLAGDAETGVMLVVSFDDEATSMHCWATLDGLGYHRNFFTHWMPLPTPPQGDDHG